MTLNLWLKNTLGYINPMKNHKLIRVATVPVSLYVLLRGQPQFMKNKGFEVGLACAQGAEIPAIEKETGIKVQILPFTRKISPFSDLKALWLAYRYFRKEKPIIVHSITPKAGLLSMIAAYFAGVPIRMHTFTGLIFPAKTGLFQKILIIMDRVLCACATSVYPEGEGVKNDLIKYKITGKPLNVIGNGNVNGIDTAYFSKEAVQVEALNKIKDENRISEDDFVFIFIGRLVKDKGIQELIAAFEQLNTKYPQAKLILVGSEEAELDPLDKNTKTTMHNHPAIHLAGFQKDVRPYLAVSNVLAFPSYREGFPNVPIQAGAMGLPAIVTDINGCNEIVKDGFNGLIIPPKDSEALYLAMKRLIDDNGLYNKLASVSRASIVSRYEQIALWKLIKAEYDEQLKQAGLV